MSVNYSIRYVPKGQDLEVLTIKASEAADVREFLIRLRAWQRARDNLGRFNDPRQEFESIRVLARAARDMEMFIGFLVNVFP